MPIPTIGAPHLHCWHPSPKLPALARQSGRHRQVCCTCGTPRALGPTPATLRADPSLGHRPAERRPA
jgi:hypothetical protein